jgi:hypothetical protein
MVDPLSASNWGLAILKWVKELPVIRGWLRPRAYPAVSIVAQRTMYGEAQQNDGAIVSQIALDCLITNGLEDRALIVARSECYVRRHGTVQGIAIADAIQPRCSAEVRFVFAFSRSLDKPHRCRIILFDQFGKVHKKWIRLQHGRMHDPFTRVLPKILALSSLVFFHSIFVQVPPNTAGLSSLFSFPFTNPLK